MNNKEIDNKVKKNTHGGKREGSGRKATGRKKESIYVTKDELVKVKEYIEKLRSE